MRVALTIDDLPVWPHEASPPDTSPAKIASSMIDTLAKHDISGVYAFSNSWPLDVDPNCRAVLDAWVAAGHHIGNHTHSHVMLNDVSAEQYTHDISVADEMLSPWLLKAPSKTFRYTLNLWGDTEEKRQQVKTYLDQTGYIPADVTTWLLEWEFDRAWRQLVLDGKSEEARKLEGEYVEFCVSQIRYDFQCCSDFFDRDVVGILLGHNVPFFSNTLDRLLSALRKDGVEFVALEEALADTVYDRVGSVVSGEFLVYQQKLAAADGQRLPRIVPEHEQLIKRVAELATALRPSTRCQLVVNERQLQ